MPLLVLYTNSRGDIARVERVEEATLLGKFATARAGLQQVQQLGQPFTLQTTVFLFDDVKRGIEGSPVLTPEQKSAALEAFNQFKPGDQFVFVDLPPVVHQGADKPPVVPPVVHVFVDP